MFITLSIQDQFSEKSGCAVLFTEGYSMQNINLKTVVVSPVAFYFKESTREKKKKLFCLVWFPFTHNQVSFYSYFSNFSLGIYNFQNL